MNVTPRIFRDVERSMSGRGGGRGICRDFRLGSVNDLSGLGSIEREIVKLKLTLSCRFRARERDL